MSLGTAAAEAAAPDQCGSDRDTRRGSASVLARYELLAVYKSTVLLTF